MYPNLGDYFWSHMPTWMWPIAITGLAGFFIYEVIKTSIKTSEVVSKLLEKISMRVRENGTKINKMLAHADHLEGVLEAANERLECATTFLVLDAAWHQEVAVIFADHEPDIKLPPRIPYTTFSKKWREGWRPEQ